MNLPATATIPASTTRTVVIVFALALLTVFAGYHMGKQLAQRDNARAAAAGG